MRNLCWPVLAALVVCGCNSEEVSRKKNLREAALGSQSPLAQPNVAELSAANAAWDEKTQRDAKWRAAVSQCLPPLIGLESMISLPGRSADVTVETRLREMGVDAGPDRTLVDNRGKTIYVAPPKPADGEQTFDFRELSPELGKFYEAMVPRDQFEQFRARGGNVFLNLSSDEPPKLSPRYSAGE